MEKGKYAPTVENLSSLQDTSNFELDSTEAVYGSDSSDAQEQPHQPTGPRNTPKDHFSLNEWLKHRNDPWTPISTSAAMAEANPKTSKSTT